MLETCGTQDCWNIASKPQHIMLLKYSDQSIYVDKESPEVKFSKRFSRSDIDHWSGLVDILGKKGNHEERN